MVDTQRRVMDAAREDRRSRGQPGRQAARGTGLGKGADTEGEPASPTYASPEECSAASEVMRLG